MAAPKKVIFDPSRPYGTIYGEHHGAAFEQGGYYFDAAYNLVESLLTEAQREEIAKAKKPISPKVEKQVEGVDIDQLNLAAWVKGDIDYPFAGVREAVKKRYSVILPTAADCAEFLATEAGLCSVDEIAPQHLAK